MFDDRTDAGEKLSRIVTDLPTVGSCILGLARGGVVVAQAIAQSLHIPFDVLVVRKLTLPGNPEYAIGAVAPHGVTIVNYAEAQRYGVDTQSLNDQIHRVFLDIEQKRKLYCDASKFCAVADKHVLLADDGMATGLTMEAAVRWARKRKAKSVSVAVPVASQEAVDKVKRLKVYVYVHTVPETFRAVGQFYTNFDQVDDATVIRILQKSRNQRKERF